MQEKGWDRNVVSQGSKTRPLSTKVGKRLRQGASTLSASGATGMDALSRVSSTRHGCSQEFHEQGMDDDSRVSWTRHGCSLKSLINSSAPVNPLGLLWMMSEWVSHTLLPYQNLTELSCISVHITTMKCPHHRFNYERACYLAFSYKIRLSLSQGISHGMRRSVDVPWRQAQYHSLGLSSQCYYTIFIPQKNQIFHSFTDVN